MIRLAMVLGESSTPMNARVLESLDQSDDVPGFPSTPEPAIRTAESSMAEDDTMTYFAKLAAED